MHIVTRMLPALAVAWLATGALAQTTHTVTTSGFSFVPSDLTIREGDTVRCTGEVMRIPVGPGVLGRVVNPLGIAIDGKDPLESDKDRPIEFKVQVRMDGDVTNYTGVVRGNKGRAKVCSFSYTGSSEASQEATRTWQWPPRSRSTR